MYLFRFFPSATACDLASPITDQYVYVTNGCINQGNNSYAIYSCAGSNYTTKFYSNSACTKFVKTTTTPITPGCVDNTGTVDNNQQLAQITTCVLPSASSSASQSALSAGAIAGIVIASVVLSAVLTGAVYYYRLRRGPKNAHRPDYIITKNNGITLSNDARDSTNNPVFGIASSQKGGENLDDYVLYKY